MTLLRDFDNCAALPEELTLGSIGHHAHGRVVARTDDHELIQRTTTSGAFTHLSLPRYKPQPLVVKKVASKKPGKSRS